MDTFELKYFSESRLMEICKKVQRERKKRLEQIEWQKFCSESTCDEPDQISDKLMEFDQPPEKTQPLNIRLQRPESQGNFYTPQDSIPKENVAQAAIAYKTCSCELLSPILEETTKESQVSHNELVPDPYACESKIALSPIRRLNCGVSSVNCKKIDLSKLEEESALVRFTANINREETSLSGPSSLMGTKLTDDLYSIQESNLPTTDRRIDEKKNYVLVHLERVVVYQNKMDLHLDKISFLFDKIPKPFDMADKNRRELRAAGFATLFSRNNIYPLERKVSDIERILSNETGPSTSQGTNRSLSKKLVEAHHLAASSLAAYLSHMPTSVLHGVPEKLQKLLELIIELANLCDQLEVTDIGADTVRQIYFGDDLNRSKCQQMLTKVHDQVANIRRNELISVQKFKHSFATSQPSQVLRRSQKGFRYKKSPYATPFVTMGSFKKSFDALARTKFGPPPRKEIKPSKLVKKKPASTGGKKGNTKPACISCKSSAEMIGDDPSETCVAQFPMTQNEVWPESLVENEYHLRAEAMKMEDAQSIIEKALGNKQEMSKELLPKLAEITDYLEKNKDIATTIRELAQYIQSQAKTEERSPRAARITSLPETKREVIITKDKNAQLIILPEYDGSRLPETNCQQDGPETCLPQNVPETRQHHGTNHPEEINRPGRYDDRITCNTFTQTGEILGGINLGSKNAEDSNNSSSTALQTQHFNTPTTPRSLISPPTQKSDQPIYKSKGPTPLFVSASSVNDVLKYTKEYKNFISKIPIYRPSLRPWKVISRISNQFVDEALRDIIKELDFDYLVTMMYKLEFE